MHPAIEQGVHINLHSPSRHRIRLCLLHPAAALAASSSLLCPLVGWCRSCMWMCILSQLKLGCNQRLAVLGLRQRWGGWHRMFSG